MTPTFVTNMEHKWTQEVMLVMWEGETPKVAIIKNGEINSYDLRKQTFDKFADTLLTQEIK